MCGGCCGRWGRPVFEGRGHGWAVRALLIAACCAGSAAAGVYPPPRESRRLPGELVVDAALTILLPAQASAGEIQLARLLTAELGDRYGLAVHTRAASALPASGRFVLMGAVSDPLVRRAGAELGIDTGRNPPGPEGYFLSVSDRLALVAGVDDAGAFYGFQSLRQLIEPRGGKLAIPGVSIRDWPDKPFRGIKMYLPGPDRIAFFKRFVRDFMALYKYNTALIEMDAAMRLDRHPELNAGWIEFGRNLLDTRRERAWGPGRQYQDSANADTADGQVLEKEQVAELVRYAREYHIEVIPELPTLTHSYYLLTRHRELAEVPGAEWPDSYCPSEPKTYHLVFDVLDEYIDVVHPRILHIGHDEWRVPVGRCPRCRGKAPTELYAEDLNRLYHHLREKNVRTAIWGDHLIEALRGRGTEHHANPGGVPYDTPGGLSAEQVRRLIPKDILVFNWFWDDREPNQGEANDRALQEWGFQQVYGNMTPEIPDYARRSRLTGVMGGAPSSWAATNEGNFGKDLMYDFLGSAEMLWSARSHDVRTVAATAQGLLPDVRRRLSATRLPSYGGTVSPVRLPGSRPPRPEAVRAGNLVFEVAAEPVEARAGAASPAISIGADAGSIVFLHAAAKPARNAPAYEATWNYDDTADLLGWYEVVYADGFLATVPVRYGLNILESGWGREMPSARTAYEAVAVNCAQAGAPPVTFFAYEWVNPRLGKAVREVRLRGAAADNAVILAALSVVQKKEAPHAERWKSTPLHVRQPGDGTNEN
jgi:hypothetical protein